MAEALYAVTESRKVVYRLQRDIDDSIAVINCDDPSLLISPSLVKIDQGQALRGFAQLPQITNEGRVRVFSTDGYFLTLYIISAREAYKLTCEHASNRERFPLGFIVEVGLVCGKPGAIRARSDNHSHLVPISDFVLQLAVREVIARENRRWVYCSPYTTHTYILNPSGWHEAIKAACQWWEKHHPDA